MKDETCQEGKMGNYRYQVVGKRGETLMGKFSI